MPWRRGKTTRGLARAFGSLLELLSLPAEKSCHRPAPHSSRPSPLVGQQQPPSSSSASVTLSAVTAQQLCLTHSPGPSSSFNAHLLESSEESQSGGAVSTQTVTVPGPRQGCTTSLHPPHPQAASRHLRDPKVLENVAGPCVNTAGKLSFASLIAHAACGAVRSAGHQVSDSCVWVQFPASHEGPEGPVELLHTRLGPRE